MTTFYAGGCACGALRYETRSDPIFENAGEGVDRDQRGDIGHGPYLTFSRRADMTIKGAVKTWRAAGDSGNDRLHAFCPTCGTPVYVTFAAMPEVVAVHAASLDDPGQLHPRVGPYGVRGHVWDTMDPVLRTLGRMPG